MLNDLKSNDKINANKVNNKQTKQEEEIVIKHEELSKQTDDVINDKM